ncbi:hypothetical protein BDR07DRAFT_1372721 [Suillus spraguei]|nr:hypothetical protein BDR07DRAFT_1372721 [Suillus spraguei]
MVLLLCAALFGVPFAHASLSGLNDTCINTFDASNSPVCNTRTVWDILSSCGLTLFACTWTAVHMNIPYMNHNKWDITGRRLLLMVLALIAPEAITILAAWELLNACKVADDFNEFLGHSVQHDKWWRKLGIMLLGYIRRLNPINCCRRRSKSSNSLCDGHAVQHDKWWRKLGIMLLGYIRRLNPINCCRRRSKSSNSLCNVWTVRHGFFAYMGGFVLHVNGQPWATLTPEELLRFVQSGSVKMPDITEADIEDRSKGDLLSKIAAICQLLWFVIQIVARHAKNLPVTLLEIDTLAIAVVACISYLLWLKKPKDVGRPYIVHWNSEATAPPSDSENLRDKH